MHSFHWALINTPVVSLYNDGTVSLFARGSYDDDISNKKTPLRVSFFTLPIASVSSAHSVNIKHGFSIAHPNRNHIAIALIKQQNQCLNTYNLSNTENQQTHACDSN